MQNVLHRARGGYVFAGSNPSYKHPDRRTILFQNEKAITFQKKKGHA